MDDSIPEVIITTSNTCSVFDAKNGNEITSYKDENRFSPKTVALIGSDYLIGAYSNKPMLKVWTLSKQRKQEVGSFVVPGPVSALAVSGCGSYCVAGIKDQIYVWEVSTGEVLNILSRHYQTISCLKFTADDSRFFSGGKDGHVMVWVLSCVVDVNARHDTVKPQFVWNKHSAEVTDIYCGFSISRVATTSLDMTCKIYELDSGMLLSSICMDVSLTAVVMDPLEYYIFLADDRGYLYKINTYERLPYEIHRVDMKNKASLQLHDKKIISLSVTFDATRLMTSSEDGTCKFWDIHAMSCLLNIRFEGLLTNAFLALRPPCLSKEAIAPQISVKAFQKDIYSSRSERKIIEARIQPQELSLMYDGCPDKYYPNALFCRTGVKPEDINIAACEESFQEAIHGESLCNLTKMNQQMYSVLLNETFKHSFKSPSSPT